jgi:hypothetical protein
VSLHIRTHLEDSRQSVAVAHQVQQELLVQSILTRTPRCPRTADTSPQQGTPERCVLRQPYRVQQGVRPECVAEGQRRLAQRHAVIRTHCTPTTCATLTCAQGTHQNFMTAYVVSSSPAVQQRCCHFATNHLVCNSRATAHLIHSAKDNYSSRSRYQRCQAGTVRHWSCLSIHWRRRHRIMSRQRGFRGLAHRRRLGQPEE